MADVAAVVRCKDALQLGRVTSCYEPQLSDVTFKYEVTGIVGRRVSLSMALWQGVPDSGRAARALRSAQDFMNVNCESAFGGSDSQLAQCFFSAQPGRL